MSVVLVYLERKRIFNDVDYCPRVGIPLMVLGIILFGFARQFSFPPAQNDNLALSVFAIVLIWIAGFVLCYGSRASGVAIFPLSFLVLMIPIPVTLVQKLSVALEKASAEIVYVLFQLAGIPVFRQGFRFSIPGLNIEVAEQCSGIRSTLAFFITSLCAGHLFLRSTCRRVYFSLITIPIVIFKNGVRIVTLSLLSIYVDPGFLTGRLHQYGGWVFGLLGLAILLPLLLLLQKSEDRAQRKQAQPDVREDGPGGNGPTPLRSSTETG
jgi:exosortase